MKLNPYLMLYTKPISKWINDIGAKNHIITKLLKDRKIFMTLDLATDS